MLLYHINEEISHSKCHFSHSDSYTRIPYFHSLENQLKIASKVREYFLPIGEMYRYRMRVQLAECEKNIMNNIVLI